MTPSPELEHHTARIFQMRMSRMLIVVIAVTSIGSTLQAQIRTSANYSVTTEVADCGGARASSASYGTVGSVGGLTGISSAAQPVEIAKHGYIAQLFSLVGLNVGAPQSFVNEEASLQLHASQLLDDSTTLVLDPTLVAWTVASGPLASISAGGLATAQIVYQDTGAVAQGNYQGRSGQLALTVRNVSNDDFGSYAGDGIDDSWQAQYFGLNNPNAGSNVDADGTGQTNFFKFVAGLNPVDAKSRFTVQSQTVNGQPLQRNIVFQPVVAGRVYVVQSVSSIASGATSWTTLTNISTGDNGSIRTVTDLNASDPERFYRVQITKP